VLFSTPNLEKDYGKEPFWLLRKQPWYRGAVLLQDAGCWMLDAGCWMLDGLTGKRKDDPSE